MNPTARAGNPESPQTQSQAYRIQNGKAQQAEKEILQTVVDPVEQQQGLFKISVGTLRIRCFFSRLPSRRKK